MFSLECEVVRSVAEQNVTPSERPRPKQRKLLTGQVETQFAVWKSPLELKIGRARSVQRQPVYAGSEVLSVPLVFEQVLTKGKTLTESELMLALAAVKV